MKISLIVCAYNTEKYIEKCLESIEKQSFNDYEAIIINDGSKDNTQLIIDEFVNKNSKFKSYYQKNSGQAVGRNKGIELAKGDYIVFVDSDDEIKEDYLKNLSKVIDLNLDFGYSKLYRRYNRRKSFLEKTFNYIEFFDCSDTTALETKKSFVKIMNGPVAKIIRRDLLINNNIRFAENKLYEDFMFTQLILLSNPKMISIDDDSYIYNIHAGSSMTGNGKRAFEMIDVIDLTLDEVKKKGLEKELKDEYEYLSLYHIAIGTLYRSFMYKPYMFFNYLYKCRKFLKEKGYTRHNKYVKEMSVFSKLFLFIFYSFL